MTLIYYYNIPTCLEQKYIDPKNCKLVFCKKSRNLTNTDLEAESTETYGKTNAVNEQYKFLENKKNKQICRNFTRLKLSSHDWLICIAVCISLNKQNERPSVFINKT